MDDQAGHPTEASTPSVRRTGAEMPVPGTRARPLIVAHRGLPFAHGENSIDGLVAAIHAGADGVEFDVRLTRDGVPIVVHDPDLKRTHERDEAVADLLASELPGDVPTLVEVLERIAAEPWRGPIDIELKAAVGPEILAALLPETIPVERVLVTSFDPAVVSAYTADGRFRAGILVRRHPFSNNILVKARPTPLSAVVTYVQHRRDTNLRRNVRTILTQLLRATDAKVVLIQDPGFIALDECRRIADEHGVELWLWTLNTKRQWARAARYRADAVITDVTDKAVRALR